MLQATPRREQIADCVNVKVIEAIAGEPKMGQIGLSGACFDEVGRVACGLICKPHEVAAKVNGDERMVRLQRCRECFGAAALEATMRQVKRAEGGARG